MKMQAKLLLFCLAGIMLGMSPGCGWLANAPGHEIADGQSPLLDQAWELSQEF